MAARRRRGAKAATDEVAESDLGAVSRLKKERCKTIERLAERYKEGRKNVSVEVEVEGVDCQSVAFPCISKTGFCTHAFRVHSPRTNLGHF